MLFNFFIPIRCFDEAKEYLVKVQGNNKYLNGSLTNDLQPHATFDDPLTADRFLIKDADRTGINKYLFISGKDNVVVGVPYQATMKVYYDDFKEQENQKFKLVVLDEILQTYHIVYDTLCLEYVPELMFMRAEICDAQNLYQSFIISPASKISGVSAISDSVFSSAQALLLTRNMPELVYPPRGSIYGLPNPIRTLGTTNYQGGLVVTKYI